MLWRTAKDAMKCAIENQRKMIQKNQTDQTNTVYSFLDILILIVSQAFLNNICNACHAQLFLKQLQQRVVSQMSDYTPRAAQRQAKFARYFQRIQNLVRDRYRTPSPIQTTRSMKPINTKSLDSFLKYQLIFKILTVFLDKNIKERMRTFFNCLQVHPENRVEKVYRFVSIEKLVQDGPVGRGSSAIFGARMLFVGVKGLVKIRLKDYYFAIKSYNPFSSSKPQSQIRYSLATAQPHMHTPTQLRIVFSLTNIVNKSYFQKLNYGFQILKRISITKYNQQKYQILISQQKKQSIEFITTLLINKNNCILRDCLSAMHNSLYAVEKFVQKFQSIFVSIHNVKKSELLISVSMFAKFHKQRYLSTKIAQQQHFEQKVYIENLHIFTNRITIVIISSALKNALWAFTRMKSLCADSTSAKMLYKCYEKVYAKCMQRNFDHLFWYSSPQNQAQKCKQINSDKAQQYIKAIKKMTFPICRHIYSQTLQTLQNNIKQLINHRLKQQEISQNLQQLSKMTNKLFSIRIIDSFSLLKTKFVIKLSKRSKSGQTTSRTERQKVQNWAEDIEGFLSERAKYQTIAKQIWEKAEDYTQNDGAQMVQ